MKIKNKRKYLSVMLCLFFVIVFTVLFGSETGFAETKFTVKPYFSAVGRLDSNFWRLEDNEREVYTYLLAPGIQLGAETPKSIVNLYYTLEAYFFEDKDDVPSGERKADDENYVGHLALLEALWSPAERFTLGLNNDFYLTRNPIEADRFSDSVEREKYWVNRFTPLIFYEFKNRFSVGLRYQRTDIEFEDSDESDFLEHRGIINLLYNPSRTLTLDLNYQRWTNEENRKALESREYTSDQIQLVAEKRYKYFAFEGGIGYHNRDFEDIGDSDVKDQDVINWKFAVTGQNPPPQEQRRLLGKQFLRARSHLYAAVERDFNNLGYFFDTFKAYRYTASVGHVFLEKIRTMARGFYQTNDYIASDREDDIFDFSGTIGYLITKKIEISFTAGRTERDSNVDGESYENAYLFLKFDFNYDIGSRGDFSEEASYYR